MPVSDLGPQDVVTVSPDATAADVVDKLETENVGSVVVTENGEPVGIVTDRDVALAVGRSNDVAETSVRQLMTEDPRTLREDQEGMEIPRAIDDASARRVPVVDDDGNVTGIVTMDDLVATIGEELGHVAKTIEIQSPEYQP